MRQYVTTLLLLCAALAGRAQQIYDTFLVEGKMWTCECRIEASSGFKTYNAVYTLSGDTVIDGRTCKKLFVQDANGSMTYNAALYQEGKKVYMITSHNVTSPTTYQLYDFGIADGGSIGLWSDMHGTVYFVDNIQQGNNTIKRQFVSLDRLGCALYLSGVGSIYGPVLLALTVGGSSRLLSCSVNGETIYSEEQALSDYELMWSTWDDYMEHGKVLVSIATPDVATMYDGPLFDLQGRRLAAKPQRGVYIQGGRKYVVR